MQREQYTRHARDLRYKNTNAYYDWLEAKDEHTRDQRLPKLKLYR
jgi:hypothetical protein